MSTKLQEGIYYRAKPPIGKSFCLISLRAENKTEISEVGRVIGSIWNRLKKLKEGITVDLNIDQKHRKIGNLTVLIAYGPTLFDFPKSKKKRPTSFMDNWNFRQPNPSGGGPILDGIGMSYSTQICENHLLLDHVVLQFIADNEFYTDRAAVEVWKELRRQRKDTGRLPLRITGLYPGFQRADYRNWLGFHDGVSNLKSRERPYVISIDSKYLDSRDRWTSHGSYLAFMRIAIDLEKWEDTTVNEQEIIIGREKLTGCPLIGIDQKRKPIKDVRCPVQGTSEVIDPGNEHFRDQLPYGVGTRSKILQDSHIGRSRALYRVPIWDRRSSRIYRQGFEFLVSSGPLGFIAGLNFVSFQNTPERLFRSLTSHRTLEKGNLSASTLTLDNFLNVLAAGIFLAPPVTEGEPFPGASIFFNSGELWHLSNYIKL
jgi:deferrochelatase/peroxidase EfeB